MMQPSSECYALIRRFEGFQPQVYLCPGGYYTIGFGHVVAGKHTYPDGITRLQAERLLENDVAIAANAVRRLLPVPLTQGQFDALVSFTFNLGAGALQRSTLRRVILRGHYREAPHQLRRWVYGGGRKLRGLIARREAEIALFESA